VRGPPALCAAAQRRFAPRVGAGFFWVYTIITIIIILVTDIIMIGMGATLTP
jgi:hypothetical protein